ENPREIQPAGGVSIRPTNVSLQLYRAHTNRLVIKCSGRSSLTPAPPLGLRSAVACFDSTLNSSPGSEFTADTHRHRVAGLDQVPENAIDRIFIEDAEIAVGRDVFLQGSELEAPLVWNITHIESPKI